MTGAISDSLALAGRHLRHMVRIPEQMLSMTLMPVAFVLVFGYLFGSSMQVPGDMTYQEYIMAGIFIQVVLSNLAITALGVVTDLDNGLMDRFRSLPISRAAVLVGRTTSDLLLVAWSFVIMSVVGLLLGWRTHAHPLSVIAGFGVLLMLALAISWLGALLGLTLRNTEAVNAVGTVAMLPMAFLSNAFIPLNGLPQWLRTVAEWNPVSVVVAACRDLFGNAIPAAGEQAFPMRYPVPMAVGLTVLLLCAVIPLAIRAFHKSGIPR
ncbi:MULTISPECIES: ABC transporter permease [unclassified Streptomyces]|uniref:ABC transporter permease n=1 Tax=unclassified Streptomyces TaxID=2593676 RepID=UPI0035D5BC3A